MTKREELKTLSAELQQYLQGEKLVLISTVDSESGGPSVTAISWLKAMDDKRVRFSAGTHSRIVANIKKNPAAVFAVIGPETVWGVYGKCQVLEESMAGVGMRLAKIEMRVEAVREAMFWGAKLTREPAYEKTYDEKKAKELDDAVYAALAEG